MRSGPRPSTSPCGLRRGRYAALFVGLFLLATGGLAAEQAASLESLPAITTIAYITAHPDDESGPVITYFARGLHARVVILCLTRGEGGQNTYGPELGEELGRLRTRELEAAARLYGAEVRFLNALDFGYSKSVEETLGQWNQAALVARLVRALRELRPTVVISRWTPEAPAGAQHQAAGIVAQQAFAVVGDPTYSTPGAEPWQARYFLTHTAAQEKALRVPVEEIAPESQKSYEEMGWEGIRQHRSQGLDRIPREQFRGRSYFLRIDALRMTAPEPQRASDLVQQLDALPVVFPRVGLLAAWEGRLAEVVARVRSAQASTVAGERAEAARTLVDAATAIDELLNELRRAMAESGEAAVAVASGQAAEVVAARQTAFLGAAAALAGIEFTAVADRAYVVPGQRFQLRLAVRGTGSDVFARTGLEATGLNLVVPPGWLTEAVTSEASAGERVKEFAVLGPLSALPGPVPLEATAAVRAGQISFLLPATIRDPQGEPVEVVPRVRLTLEPALRLVPTTLAGGMLDWDVQAENHDTAGEPLPVALEVPPGWTGPLPQSAPANNPATVRLRFQALLPERLEPASLRVRARTSGSPPVEGRVEVLEVTVPGGLRIGYIGFNNDPVPALLAQLGIAVDMLDEATLARPESRSFGTGLDPYDAVVVAERAYDFREDLPGQTARLLDYVKRGGTLVVEHQGARAWQQHKPSPYPASMGERGNLRVTREDAPVRVLVADHPALNFPHRITEQDFQGWVQERGLYFLGEWDAQLTPLVEMADPGEEALRGGLLYARWGEGVYIYSGLALFRQVRAGVAGGVRLFVNLLSQRRAR